MSKNINIPKLRFKEFSGVWEEKKLGEVSDISSGGTPLRNKSSYWNGTIPWVTTSLINFKDIYSSEEYITEEGLNNSSAKLFKKNTILMAMYGEGKTRGKVGILKINATTNQACASISPKGINHVFLYQYLMNQYDNIRNLSNEGGQKNLSGSIIKNIFIPYPTKEEQEKIAIFLSSIDEKIEKLTKKDELLQQYKKSIMQKIFSQDIRFKDDKGKEFPEWEEKKLGNLCDVIKGEQLNKDNLTEIGDYPAINGGISPSGFTDKWNTLKNTITISEGGNSCGYVNFIKINFWSGGHNYSLQNLKENIENIYLFQYLKYNESQIMNLRVGSGLPNIQKRDIVNSKISLPCIEEQNKIANFLSSIDDKIEENQKVLEKVKEFKKSLLQQMFV